MEEPTNARLERRKRHNGLMAALGAAMKQPELSPLTLTPLSERPLVSILVANYNYARFIDTALASLLSQTYGYFEALVCDDGSTDDSCGIVEGFAQKDTRVRLLRKENGGVGSALNRAYSESGGSILCILDADDYYHPEKLASIVAAFRSNQVGVIVHPLTVVDANDKEVQRKPAFDTFERGWIADKVIARGGRWMYMEASAVCFRREIAQAAFPIDEERFHTWADTYLCILGALLAPVSYVNRALAYYRLHGSNVSGYSALGAEQAAKGARSIERVLEGVQLRMAELGRPCTLDATQNLTFRESSFQAALFQGATGRPPLVLAFLRYARSVASDDIYSPARKLVATFFLGTAIALPVSLRAKWVSAAMTESGFKERLRVLIEGLRRRPGSGSTARGS